ncbi:MAG: hypothetical protein Q8R53_04210 [Nanoarchaeota archaeon]|nr:hypothetical protein [Nanoarchaeota archaeon]
MIRSATKRKSPNSSWNRLLREIQNARKDPRFMKEVQRFVKITTR